jgi:hypothetical protein
MKLSILTIAMGSMFMYSTLHSFDFVDSSMDGFIQRVVPLDEAQPFKSYYQEFIVTIKKLASTKKKAELQRLRELARSSLEIKHPDWAQQLKPYAFYERDETVGQEKKLKSIRLFLTRYAAYEEFLKYKALEKAGMWSRFKSYSKHVSQKCTGWVSSLIPSKKMT